MVETGTPPLSSSRVRTTVVLVRRSSVVARLSPRLSRPRVCVSLCRRRHDTSRLLAPAARVTSPQVHNSDLLLAFGVRFDDRVTGKVCNCRFFKTPSIVYQPMDRSS